jgi:hypothetical protein
MFSLIALGGRFKLLICRGQCAAAAVNASLTMNLKAALTIKIYREFTTNVPSSFALAAESATRAP